MLIFELKLCYLKDSGATDEQLMAMAPWVYTDILGEMQQICPDWDAGLDEEQSDDALQAALIFGPRVERLRLHLRLTSTMRLVLGKDGYLRLRQRGAGLVGYRAANISNTIAASAYHDKSGFDEDPNAT